MKKEESKVGKKIIGFELVIKDHYDWSGVARQMGSTLTNEDVPLKAVEVTLKRAVVIVTSFNGEFYGINILNGLDWEEGGIFDHRKSLGQSEIGIVGRQRVWCFEEDEDTMLKIYMQKRKDMMERDQQIVRLQQMEFDALMQKLKASRKW